MTFMDFVEVGERNLKTVKTPCDVWEELESQWREVYQVSALSLG